MVLSQKRLTASEQRDYWVVTESGRLRKTTRQTFPWYFFLFPRKVLWLLSQPQWTYTLNFLSVLIHLFTPWLCVDALGKACFLDMLNYFRERLAPLVYSSHLRTEFRLIRWMQRKRLLKRNVNCTGCGNIMNFNACRRKRDGYQWYVPGFFVDRVTS